MSDHGHFGYLRTYVLHDAPLADVPSDGVNLLMDRTTESDERLLLLRRPIESWRAKEQSFPELAHRARHQFVSFFRTWRKPLAVKEATAVLNEIVGHTLSSEDKGVNGQFGDARFTSMHALELFQIFDTLSELDPEHAQELVKAHSELARAIERYPGGPRTIQEEADAERAKMPPRDPNQGAFIISGSGQPTSITDGH